MGTEKMKRFIECYLPIKACNMKCSYCYVTQNGWWEAEKPDFSLCLNKIKAALAPERMGGTCMINVCATGETLLNVEVPQIIRAMLEDGHYVMVVTNGILTERFQVCCELPKNLRKNLFFKFSFHYLELKKQNKLDIYFSNIKMIQSSGISFTVEITPDDGYIPYIEEIKNICIENLGSVCHVTVPRDERIAGYPLMTKLSREEFVKTWSQFDSELFRFKESIFNVKRKEFCYAGEWGIVLNLGTGEYKQCYKGKVLGNLYDLDRPLRLLPVGHNCVEGHCFNGHAFLGFGLIPELENSNYADMRNRKLGNGSQWLSADMESFMRCKLRDANHEDGIVKKIYSDIQSFHYKDFIKKMIGKK